MISSFKNASSKKLLEKLVSFKTISADSNLDLITFVEGYLSLFGIASKRIENPEKTKANLFATIGPEDIAGVMLSGHTDVVPVAGQNWSSDPFEMLEESGKLFGRGTADMKGFIASALAALPEMVAKPLHRPIHLAFSYDEEVGCLGVRDMITMLAGTKIRPLLCIIGEPTLMQIAILHKGKSAYRVTCVGKEIHSGFAPLGLNAIHIATDVIRAIQGVQHKIKTEYAHDDRFDIPYTTLHIGTINGGTALNIVPNFCSFDFEIRNLNSDRQSEIISQIQNAANNILGQVKDGFPDADIRFELLAEYPGLSTPAESEAVTYLKSLVHTNHHTTINFGTEGGLFQQELDLPVVVCGPGSIKFAHKPDEFVEISQLEKCDALMQALIKRLQNPT